MVSNMFKYGFEQVKTCLEHGLLRSTLVISVAVYESELICLSAMIISALIN